MITVQLLVAFISVAQQQDDSLQNFRNQLGRSFDLYMRPLPDFFNMDTCYHYTELLKLEINKSSKVVSVDFSDSAPQWIKKELNTLKEKNKIDFRKLDSLTLKGRLHNRTLVFPLIIESEDFPCGQDKKQRTLSEIFFQFNGKNLQGNLIFGPHIRLIYGVHYKF